MTEQIASDIISVGWLIENKILKVQIGGAPESHTMAIAENGNYDDAIVEYLNAAAEPIYLVIHIQPVNTTPSLSRVLSFKYPRHPRMGYLIIVNTSNTPMVRFFMSVMGSMVGVKLKGAQSIDEALEFLEALKPHA